MATWGTLWGLGHLWGTGSEAAQFYCELADERALVQMDTRPGTRNFRDMMCIFAEAFGDFQAVAFDVRDGFDVATAVGVQQDAIGAVIGLTRQGFDDARYRTFLEIQIDLLLSAQREEANWTGTINNVLTICRKFIGTGVALPIIYQGAPPYAFLLTIPGGLPVNEIRLLFQFVCKAIYAGVLGQTIFVPAGDNLYDSVNVAIPNSGIYCSVNVVIANCAVYSTILGTDNNDC